VRAARWFSALASQFCSASFFKLRIRPNRSSSQLLMPTCTASDSVTWVTPVSLLASLTRERVTLPLASTDGSSAARWMRYCARSFSTCSTATRRSRLFCSASAMTCCRRGSRNTSRRAGIASAGSAAPMAALPNCAGTGASGRW